MGTLNKDRCNIFLPRQDQYIIGVPVKLIIGGGIDIAGSP